MIAFQLQETLIIVTADHAHTMVMNGYPLRGQDITGKSFILLNEIKIWYISIIFIIHTIEFLKKTLIFRH